MRWRELTSVDQLGQLIEASEGQRIAIFKHSTRCSISSMAKNRLEREWQHADESFPIYLLDLLRHRDVSNDIARRLGVVHESPQLIVIKNGAATYHSSHNVIAASAVPV